MRLSWARRALAVVGLAATVGALGTAPTSGLVGAHRHEGLTPIVECSAGRGSRTRTLYGYDNTGPVVNLAVGPGNEFSPGPPDRGQPTTFERGTRINVFSVAGSERVTWTLGDGRAQAPGPSCRATPAGSSLAGWGPIAAVVIVTAVLGLLLFWRTRRLRAVAP